MAKNPREKDHEKQAGQRRGVRALLERLRRWRWPSRRNILLAGGVFAALLAVVYTAAFFWPRTVAFSFAGNNCITQPLLLPRLASQNTGNKYQADPVASLSVAGYPLYSHKTCITPVKAPKGESQESFRFGAAIFTKKITVNTGALPSLAANELAGPVATQEPLELKLSTADRIFDYRLAANGSAAACETRKDRLICDVAELKLTQSKTYEFRLEQLFGDEPARTITERPVKTVRSVRVAKTSVKNGGTIYDKPKKLTLTLNREAVRAEDIKLEQTDGNERKELGVTAEVDGKTISLTFAKPLPRQASFALTVGTVAAGDGGLLAKPYKLTFKTSGGPKVNWANIGSYKVPRGQDIIINFDAPASGEQNLAKFVRLEANGEAVPAVHRISGNNVIIDPESTLPRCAPLTLRVLDGLENRYGVSGGSAWQYNSRTMCQVVTSIGASVKGRSIAAYHFGTGGSTVLFVGGTHGNETGSVRILGQWIEVLEANPGRIPSHRKIVVVPNVNPDGYAAGTRHNANNVDLNRNFPTNDWKSDVTFGDGTHHPNGGGSKPLSEPESKALANFTLSLNPRLVITYHNIAGYVIPNDSGDSDALARDYAAKSDLRYASHSQTGVIFPYDTTGAYEDWLHQKHGVPALLIETWTRAGNEFPGNQNAMWQMAGL